MHFTIEKETFWRALSRIQGIVEKRNTIPILANVLIETSNADINLTATDLEVGMRASYSAKILSQGKITLSAKKLFEIIKELPDREISFKAKDNCWVEIKCGKSIFNIVGLSAEEFPSFPPYEEASYLSIESGILKEMLEKTSFAQSSDETKYNLSGIFFKVVVDINKNKFFRMVATDGHRLSMIEKNIDFPNIESLNTGVIFPKKGIAELKKIADDTNGVVDIGFMDNSAIIKKDQAVIVMRLVDGEFPDYTRVIPRNNDNTALIGREKLLHALRRMSILSSEKSRGVKIVFKDGLLDLSSSNPDIGEACEDMDMEYHGPEISIGFNARYLLDVLQTQDSEFIRILLKDNLAPGVIKTDTEDGYLAVVMPMRL